MNELLDIELEKRNMELVSIATIITAFATLALAFATFYYAFTNRKLMLSKEREMQRPRKKDEIESIIIPIINQCSNEIKRIKENNYWFFTKLTTFFEDIQKKDNEITTMLYEDFILNNKPLSKMLGDHDSIFIKMRDQCNSIINIFNQKKIRDRIGEMLKEYNKETKNKYAESSIGSLSTNLLIIIIENKDVNKIILSEPEKTIWNKHGNELLSLRNQDLKKPLKKLETNGKEMIQINQDILNYLKTVCDKYTKEYGISLDKELKSYY